MRIHNKWLQQLLKIDSNVTKTPIKIALIAFVVTMATFALSLAPITHAATSTPITGVAGKCLDVQGGKAFARNKVQLYTCNTTIAQQWEQPGDGTIRNQGYCLDAQWGNRTPKTPVWLYDCNGSAAQQWKVNGDGSLVSLRSNLCLDDQYGGTHDENPIWTYGCNTTVSQKWTLVVPMTVATPTPAPVVTTPAPQTSTGDGYTNVDGNHVASPSSNPAGATAQCGDGTYSYSQHHSGTCSHHGGVATWL